MWRKTNNMSIYAPYWWILPARSSWLGMSVIKCRLYNLAPLSFPHLFCHTLGCGLFLSVLISSLCVAKSGLQTWHLYLFFTYHTYLLPFFSPSPLPFASLFLPIIQSFLSYFGLWSISWCVDKFSLSLHHVMWEHSSSSSHTLLCHTNSQRAWLVCKLLPSYQICLVICGVLGKGFKDVLLQLLMN